jgi:hypothetical protein
MSATATLPPAGVLLLARLLAAGDKGETRDKVRKELEPLLGHRWSGGALTELIDRTVFDLVTAGLVVCVTTGKGKKATERLVLTDEGRRRGLSLLKVDQLPPKTTWATLKKVYLPALALGLPGPKGATETRFKAKGGFEAAVLKVGFGLPVDDFPTGSQATDALIWKLLGIDSSEKFGVTALKKHLFNRELGDKAAGNEKVALRRLLARTVDACRDAEAELRAAVVRRWVDGRPVGPGPGPGNKSTPVAAGPLSLEEFAHRVVQAARTCPTGRFGDNKVFIAHVWRAFHDDPAFQDMDIIEFKRRLTEANQARLLDLTRADLVEAMDPEDVRSSETLHFGATFHFVRL